MFWCASRNLLRTVVHGGRIAIVTRQPNRLYGHLSYDKEFSIDKRDAEYKREKQQQQLMDEDTRKIRSVSENIFLQNGVIISAYSEVSPTVAIAHNQFV